MQLTDWPDGARRPRDILIHKAYLRAAWRGNVRCGWIFTPDEVAQHDWWTSTACGQLVPREWDAAHLATAPAYTFRVPWADGGRYDKANARLAHYGCAAFADPSLGPCPGPRAHPRPGGQDQGQPHRHALPQRAPAGR